MYQTCKMKLAPEQFVPTKNESAKKARQDQCNARILFFSYFKSIGDRR